MILQAPVVATPSSSSSAAANELVAPQESGSGEFIEALMELISGAETVPEAGADAGSITLLVDGTADATAPASESMVGATAPAPVIAAVLQPSEIRAAQGMVHKGSADTKSAAGQGASGSPSPMPLVMAAPPDEAGLVTIDTAPNGTLSEAPTASSVGLPQAVAQEGFTTARTSHAEAPVPRQVQAQVGTPAWTEELGTQLHLMADKGQHTASLRLSPEHLGPLEVQVSVKDDKATVWFGAANVDTRAAIEQAMPRLRELFAAQGMSLDQSGVFPNARQDAGRSQRPASSADPVTSEDAGLAPVVTVRRGLIDAYA